MTRPLSASTPSFLALSCIGAIAVATPGHAQETGQGQKLGGVTVTDTAITENEGRQQASPKATRPVRDTPQTVTILTNQVIEQQNLLTLRDVLSTVPGITFGAGEGGGGYGDSINLRGYSANTDITVDGVRDSAQYTRTDPFNLEQVEVTNGANSAVAGSGSVGGSINLVTKRPTADTQVIVNGGIGTDNYYRGTIDANVRASDLIALRLNAMAHQNDVPGRDVEDYQRWGIAPSVTIGIESPTRLTLQYLHQQDENIPQYGVPYYINASYNGPIPGVHTSDYFGSRNVDTQKINVDQLTATFEHDFSDRVNIRNLSRWQDVQQLTRVSPPQGTYCLASGLLPTGAACPASTPPGYYLASGPRGNTRDSRNQLMYNQTDLKAVFDTGGLEHTLVLGASVAWEKYGLLTGNWARNADGTAIAGGFPLINIANPNEVVVGPAGFAYGSNLWTGPVNFIPTAKQNGELENYAAYLFDTVKVSEQFEINGAIRYEKNKGWYRNDTVARATATSDGDRTIGTKFHNDDNLFSYRVGLVYKPVEAVSVYAAYGNAKTPSKTSVNGSCAAETCNVKPESAKNYEVGVKAELGSGVLLTAAVFRNERDQYKVASVDPTIPDQQLDGKSRVNGVALSASGQVTSALSITANYTYLDSKVIRSVADNAPPGTTPPADAQAGNPLTNVPKHSGSLFATYAFPFGLKVGYGMTYQGSFYLNNALTTPTTVLYKAPDYMIHNAYLAYDFTDNISAQINVKNFTDKVYYTRIRNNGWATTGERRSAVLTVAYKF
ncbi:TonB-dependent receptor [Novosphingobium album (ex Liu et al. 2023)]|uniref:TonB-dependent receptor n=1 Tax=Novosphingobium album (ex Liu et al. 2023) TaxID=3031130 RepID=A0ABT5WN74_9SPHN|nr:TonB-dependent receptor [Novosphingobium album (ex Liu et al. 2023)]MDE8651498.1 TonB-dependent receptor [Novosphingobium album (ex Liu et al. 2023)]